MKCQCKPECDLETTSVVHVVDQAPDKPGSATVRPVSLAHLLTLAQDASDAAAQEHHKKKKG